MAKKKPANPDQLGLFEPVPAAPRASATRAVQPPLPIDLGPVIIPPTPPPPPWTPRRGAEGALDLEVALRLECNLALMAGAGTGKTYSLVTLCLHLLAGARHAGVGPIEPGRLCLVTFTDKAAGEMRTRLRQRIDALAHGLEDPDLSASYRTLEQTPKPASFWRKVRDGLGSATIGTFHGLCVQLLKRAPAGSGVNPSFELLDERAARELLSDTIERVVLGALEAGNPAVIDLCREYDFAGNPYQGGLVNWLWRAWARIREEGLDPRLVPVGDEQRSRESFSSQVKQVRGLLSGSLPVKFADKIAYALAALDGMTLENAHEPNRLTALEAVLANNFKDLKPAKDATKELRPILGEWRVAPYEQTVRQLLVEIEQAHARALERKGALDFTGLLVTARNLLRDHSEFRHEAQARFGALLVDEFQDTNRLQLELVMLLSERRAGPRAQLSQSLTPGFGDEILKLPLEPAFLCAVGDPKQSIYEFRGADVSVFGRLANHIFAEGGGRAFLGTSRRATPALVEFFNQALPHVMPRQPNPRPWDIAFGERDVLTAHRTDGAEGRCVTRLVSPLEGSTQNAEQWRLSDATAVARYLAWLLRSSSTLITPRDGAPRPIRGADVALLFRRFTQVELYRQALATHSVPHRVVRGRGFFGAQEVVDLASLLAVVANPSDVVSLAAVLRSPLVGLTDAALLLLGANRGLHAHGLLTQPLLQTPLLQAWERERLEVFRSVWAQLRRERDRLGLRALLKVALDETGYRTQVAAAPFGEQALANLDKLLELAADSDSRGLGCASFARELIALAEAVPLEAQGDVVDDGDAFAVTICTVHQAKGLEWPVVVIPELFTGRPQDNDALRFERDQGLSLRPPETDDGKRVSKRHTHLKAERDSRSLAEQQRLFYVAITRARDRLVFGLTPKDVDFARLALAAVNPMPAQLDPAKATPAVHPSVEEIDPLTLTIAPAEGRPPVPPDAADQVQKIVDRVLHPPAPVSKAATLAVTQLQDFVTCPRRYRFAHLVGLAERPVAFAGPADFDESDGPSLDPRQRGIAAHRLLELTPLEDVGTPRLHERLVEIAATEGLAPSPEVLGWVEAFWATGFGKAVKAAGPAKVHRELPFLLKLDDGEGFSLMLRGQIDLLVESEGGAQVVDYKATPRPVEGLGPYAFQLGCYALAASKFVVGNTRIQTGISFLREKDPTPLFVAAAPGLEAQLARQARTLVRSQLEGKWEGRELKQCEALKCGYVYRCHGS